MARKHGFRGTPVRPPKTPSSIGGIFERRGDPMVSAREGREKYGRNLESEDPDFDRYFAEENARFKAASEALKPSQIDKGQAFRKAMAKPYDPQRAAANAVMKMDREMRKATVNVANRKGKPHRVKGSFYYFPDVDEKEKDAPKLPPRPFFGKPLPKIKNKKRKKK